MAHPLARLSRALHGFSSGGFVSLLAMAVFFSGVPASTADAVPSQPAVQAEVSAITPLLSYQGRLLDPATGAPKADGIYTFVFRLYDVASGGSDLWIETKDLRVSNGLFITLLGDTAPLSMTIFTGQELWLGVQVDGDAEATPRHRLAPLASAMIAGDAVGQAGLESATKITFDHPESTGAAYLEIDPAYAGASGFRLGSDDQAVFNGVRDTTYQLGFNVHPVNTSAASMYLQWEEWYQYGTALSRSEFILIGKQPASAGGAYVRPWQVNMEHDSDNVTNNWQADAHSFFFRGAYGNTDDHYFVMGPTQIAMKGPKFRIDNNNTPVFSFMNAAGDGFIDAFKFNTSDKVEIGAAGYGVVVPDELTVKDYVSVRSGNLGALDTRIVLNQGYTEDDRFAHYIKSVNTNNSAADNRVAFFISDATNTGNNEVLSVTGNKRAGVNDAAPAGALHVETGSDAAAVPVLVLEQVDVSEEFMRFVGTSGTDEHSSLVDLTDVPEMGALKGWIKVHIEDSNPSDGIADGTYFVPFYQGPPDEGPAQTITFTSLPDRTLGDAPFTVGATASSGLPVSFSSSTPSVCTVSGSTVTLAAAGACTVVAAQAGDATYNAAPDVARSFTVYNPATPKQDQTITFAALSDRTLGDSPFTASATASSGLPVSFSSSTPSVCTVSGSTVTLAAAGACTVVAAQAGDATYNAAPNVARSFTVYNPATPKQDQTITFAALPDRTLGDAPFTVSATASSGLAVSFSSSTPAVCTVSGNTVTLAAAGACTVVASQAGDATYNAAPDVARSFTVVNPGTPKQDQTITFAALPDRTLGDAPFTVSATASSGLPVSFSSSTPAVCTVSGSTVTLAAAGACTVVASQAGDATYNAAPNVANSFSVQSSTQETETESVYLPLISGD